MQADMQVCLAMFRSFLSIISSHKSAIITLYEFLFNNTLREAATVAHS